MNALYALARADFLERVRRYSFLMTLAFSVYLGLAAARGQISLRLGEYSGVPNSAWVGTVMSLTTTVFLSLAGFYIVANSLQRDEQTRVGSVLAATPMSRFAYTLAKTVSNFAVLSAMVAILAIAGAVTILLNHAAPLELGKLLAPFVFIALPTMALVAAVAVFFEATPILRRISAFAYFFLWVFTLSAAVKTGLVDPIGMNLISKTMTSSLHALYPEYGGAISFGMIVDNLGAAAHRKAFLWTGIPWTASLILQRLLLFPIAAAITLLPAFWFHRFDPARERLRLKVAKSASRHDLSLSVNQIQAANRFLQPAQLTIARKQSSLAFTYVGLIAGELRLLAARRTWIVYAIAVGLLAAGIFMPLDSARHGLIVAIWILPLLVWSRLGAREDIFTTRSLIFTAPGATLRPLVAAWIAAALLPLVLAFGVVLRLALIGEIRSAAALVIGAFFVAALALTLGNLARTPRLFEAIYMCWWYFGPVQAIPGMDFTGSSSAAAYPGLYAALAVGLLLVAWGSRSLRLLRA